MADIQTVRNLAIVAHVDHGKTTLIDRVLEQSDTVDPHQKLNERAMDTHDLEKERGITILSKCTAIQWRDFDINIIDTPGHADFGGEVERVLKMVDSILLLVDAFEGPMPQTKYVLGKSLELGHEPIVAINKIDRDDARPHEVLDDIFELFLDLGAEDGQLDFPVIYSSGKEGFAVHEMDREPSDLTPLFETIVEHVPAPEGDVDAPAQMQVTTLDADEYVGRVAIGRMFNGVLEKGDQVSIARRDGSRDRVKIRELYGFQGLNRVERDSVRAGQLCAIAGMENIVPGETICAPNHVDPLPMIEIDEPTISMVVRINDSPFAGLEGDFMTSRQIRERLDKELERNVALQVEQIPEREAFKLSGRGELHLAVLLEQMRREGFELQVAKPTVITKQQGDQTLEPYEKVVVDVDADYSGDVINSLQQRYGEMTHMETNSDGTRRLEFSVPARGLIGYRSEFLSLTRGTGIMHKTFDKYRPIQGELEHRRNGVLIAKDEGITRRYSLHRLQQRGRLFLGPGEDVYGGQIIGECSRAHDLVVNPCKQKELTNVRAAGSDDALELEPPSEMTLEKAIQFIADDEYVEVTPGAIRLRKKVLHHGKRD